jgi:hypothetical protein
VEHRIVPEFCVGHELGLLSRNVLRNASSRPRLAFVGSMASEFRAVLISGGDGEGEVEGEYYQVDQSRWVSYPSQALLPDTQFWV